MVSFRLFGREKLEWNRSRWELNIKIIKVAQMAKSRMESILYMSEVSMMQNRYDLHHIASENGEQLHKNKVWMKGVGVVKVESI